ncbi:DUF4097 domain-containing protein [Vagococcus sp. PNs007]|uniref:DUF4097 domain-containing protein n=1 Tax=Vagococcus proximus TaxID=2991417 RepID=A0ABT5X3S8_9ENTE|nr:DUF4097 family beta strand repeat-containing protein [Vagococcus proximus]MDF0480646.1 DUF4097 domain-containing protein [Vagococcus proximus]
MTKKMISLASFGILLLIIGVAGGTFYYVKADKQLSAHIKEEYQPKNKKTTDNLELTIAGDLNYRISQSDDTKFHVEGTTYSLDKNQKFDWKKSETDDTTKMELNFTKSTKKSPPIGVNFWETDHQSVYLSIPKSYKTITVKGQKNSQVNLFDMTTDNLILKNEGAHVTLANSKLTTLNVTGNASYISLFDLKVEKEITASNDSTTLDISNTKSPNIHLKNNDGEILASEVKGSLEVITENGDISLTEITGPITATSQNGTLNWDGDHLEDDTSLTTVNGDVFARFGNRPKNSSIKAKSQNGDITLFNKDTDHFKIKNAKHTLSIETSSGDIDVSAEGYEDYDDELNDDF